MLAFDIDVEKFIEDTRVSEIHLDECFQKQSSLRAYYGAMAAQYEAKAQKMKTAFEVLEARLFKKYRDDLAATGQKFTEKQIENLVKVDPKWFAGRTKVAEAQRDSDVMKALVMSLVDRRDMLIQLGADRRDESKGQLRMLTAQAEQQRMNALTKTTQAIFKRELNQ